MEDSYLAWGDNDEMLINKHKARYTEGWKDPIKMKTLKEYYKNLLTED